MPHGEKPRLVMLHLNSEAMRTSSPIIDVEGSMTAFVRALGIHAHGRNIRTLRDQTARLAAAHITLGIGSKTIKTDVIDAFRQYLEKNPLSPVIAEAQRGYVDVSNQYGQSLAKRSATSQF